MKEALAGSDYAQLREQIELLRKEMEELKADRSRESCGNLGGRWRRFAGRHSWAWLRVSAIVLLALGLLGAQNKQDALFIDSKGNVGINQTNPEKTLDVNGDALVRGSFQINGNASVQGQVTGKLDVTGNAVVRGQLQASGVIPAKSSQALPAGGVVIGNSDIYFANTPHSHTAQGNQPGFAAIENESNTFKALMILGRQGSDGRMVGMWDRVGIGRADPKVALDVVGEIRGKLWQSAEFEWTQGESDSSNTHEGSVRMTKAATSVCFLTAVRGRFYGREERVEIVENKQDGYWYLQGRSQQIHVRVRARCIGAPDDSWK